MLEEGRIRHHREVRAVEFEAHVDLLGDAGQQLRQRLVDRVERNDAGNPRVDVDIDLGVARQREEQILDLNVVDDDAVGLGLGRGARLGHGQRLLDRGRNVAARLG